jgi:flavin-dependent dehydrogenase
MPYDLAVIGGGPGGSTVAALAARRGMKVLVLEREKFPRFHIGESLIPFGNEVLAASGAWEKVEKAGFIVKPGADFTLGNAKGLLRLWFSRSLSPRFPTTFQVERSKFDALLLGHAADSGAEVIEEAKVDDITLGEGDAPHRLSYTHGGESRTAEARWLIDATGRDAFLGRKLKLPKTDLGMPKRIATFAHFKGVLRNEGAAAGNITIVRLDDGWFWFIPLDAEKTSVGLVQRSDRLRESGLTPQESFEQAVAESTELRFRLKHAERLGGFHIAGDYTYRHHVMAGPRWILVGDAAGFIDPIFSSGVMIALQTARLADAAIAKADAMGRPLSGGEQRRYLGRVRKMTGVFLKLIRAYYDNRSFEVFMNPTKWLDLTAAVNSLVSGNTKFHFGLWWRVHLFFLLCRLQRRFQVAPRLDFSDKPVQT